MILQSLDSSSAFTFLSGLTSTWKLWVPAPHAPGFTSSGSSATTTAFGKPWWSNQHRILRYDAPIYDKGSSTPWKHWKDRVQSILPRWTQQHNLFGAWRMRPELQTQIKQGAKWNHQVAIPLNQMKHRNCFANSRTVCSPSLAVQHWKWSGIPEFQATNKLRSFANQPTWVRKLAMLALVARQLHQSDLWWSFIWLFKLKVLHIATSHWEFLRHKGQQWSHI